MQFYKESVFCILRKTNDPRAFLPFDLWAFRKLLPCSMWVIADPLPKHLWYGWLSFPVQLFPSPNRWYIAKLIYRNKIMWCVDICVVIVVHMGQLDIACVDVCSVYKTSFKCPGDSDVHSCCSSLPFNYDTDKQNMLAN